MFFNIMKIYQTKDNYRIDFRASQFYRLEFDDQLI
jgi:hypothetical protein